MKQPSLIVSRSKPEPHCELHYDKEVVFKTLDGRILGRSKVEVYNA